MTPIQALPPSVRGTGDPNCPKCRGRGLLPKIYTPEERAALAKWVMAETVTVCCPCAQERREREALDRVWRGLAVVRPIASSVLVKYVSRNLRILSTAHTLKKHLARVMQVHKDYLRATRVITDLDLISAWLATAGGDIFDQDVIARQERDRDDMYMRLVDLVAPPALLVIRLGVKAARNVAVPEVILEALQCRTHRNRPTWIVEDPAFPLAPGAICWSPALYGYITEWHSVGLDNQQDLQDLQDCIPGLGVKSPQNSNTSPQDLVPNPVESCSEDGTEQILPPKPVALDLPTKTKRTSPVIQVVSEPTHLSRFITAPSKKAFKKKSAFDRPKRPRSDEGDD